MKAAIFILSALLFWQQIHATSSVTSSDKVLRSKVSQIVQYNETAVEEVLEDPRCPEDRLLATAKCACFMAWMKGTLTSDGDTLCREAFGKDPSQLNACTRFTDSGILNEEKATMDSQTVTEECLSGRFDKDSFLISAVRIASMRHSSVRAFPMLVIIIVIIIITTTTADAPTKFTPSPSPSDSMRMLTQEFVRNFSPKTAKLLSYNS